MKGDTDEYFDETITRFPSKSAWKSTKPVLCWVVEDEEESEDRRAPPWPQPS